MLFFHHFKRALSHKLIANFTSMYGEFVIMFVLDSIKRNGTKVYMLAIFRKFKDKLGDVTTLFVTSHNIMHTTINWEVTVYLKPNMN